MNIRQSSTEEIALLLQGLRSIYVADSETTRQKLVTQFEKELSTRGVSLAA